MKYWRQLFSTGYVNPVDHLPDVSASQSSEIVSILSAGTFFGALLSAPVADNLGRRWGMIFNTVVFTFGVILQTTATRDPNVRGRSIFCGSRRRSSFCYYSTLSIGDCAKVDSRPCRCKLPVLNHDRAAACRHRAQCNQKPKCEDLSMFI